MATESRSNQDKISWCELGSKAERILCGPPLDHGCALSANPERAKDPYAIDAILHVPCDIKTVATPFRTSDRYGIPPEKAITLNVKDVERYTQLYPVCVILFHIVIPGRECRRVAFLSEIERAIRHGAAPIHRYHERQQDTQGNARQSYVLNEEWFRRI